MVLRLATKLILKNVTNDCFFIVRFKGVMQSSDFGRVWVGGQPQGIRFAEDCFFVCFALNQRCLGFFY